MSTHEEVPTVCVCNAIDTLHDLAARSADAEELVAECYPQQDQALYWEPLDKLIVTYEPIRDLAWQADFLGLADVVNLSPARTSGSLFADLLDDERLIKAVVDHAGPDRRLRLVPHTTTPALWEFVTVLEREHGIRVDLPESTADQGLRDLLDTKTGLRRLAADLGLTTGPCRIPDGVHCADAAEAVRAVQEFLDRGTPCIVKADRGEASVGLLVFRPGHDRSTIAEEVLRSPFYGEDPVVVEEFVDGDTTFPAVEYVVPANPAELPRLFSVTSMLFGAETRVQGNVTARELESEHWYDPLVDGGLRIAAAIQARGYRGHFGIDAVARDREVFLLDLNARRTGSTHLHEFGRQIIGTDYLDSHVIGHFDYYELPTDLTADQVRAAWGPLVRSPKNADSGLLPAELTGLSQGRLSSLVFAPDLVGFHDVINKARAALREHPSEHK